MKKLLLISTLLLCFFTSIAQQKNQFFVYDRLIIEECNVNDCIMAEYGLGIAHFTDSVIYIGNSGFWKNPKPKDKKYRYIKLDTGEPVAITKHFRSPSKLVAVSVKTKQRNYFYTSASL